MIDIMDILETAPPFVSRWLLSATRYCPDIRQRADESATFRGVPDQADQARGRADEGGGFRQRQDQADQTARGRPDDTTDFRQRADQCK